jgi:HNH endonuclease
MSAANSLSVKNQNMARTFSPELRAQISAKLKGRTLSPEHRAKVSAGLHLKRYGGLTIEQRFWKHVEPITEGNGCWEWTGETSHGYGVLGVKSFGKNIQVRATRFSFQLHYGPVNLKLFMCHKCDNPRCVRPDHLFPGTQADNLRDMQRKGRAIGKHTLGDDIPCSKGHTGEFGRSVQSGRYCRRCHRERARAKRRETGGALRRL